MPGSTTRKLAFYSSVGAALTHYDVDAEAATLTRRATIELPEMVQYVWPHASRRYFYVASSTRGTGSSPAPSGSAHHLTALRIDPANGALSPHGNSLPLPARPIHLTTDIPSTHVLTAYNQPSSITVHRVNADGTVGGLLEQSKPLDCGIYAHQVRVTPANNAFIVVARGNAAAAGKPEDPGALKAFSYSQGRLTLDSTAAPNGGRGFGPRHLDFHPSKPLVYVSIETQNEICVFGMSGDGLEPEPLWRKTSLAEPGKRLGRQAAGTIHVHPNGRFAYIANRAYASTQVDGRRVASGGENNFAVFALDAATGEPTLIQNIPTEGYGTRTFAIDPSGRLLLAGNLTALDVREASGYRTVPASIAVFRIAADGHLAFVRKYDLDVGAETQFWTGMIELP